MLPLVHAAERDVAKLAGGESGRLNTGKTGPMWIWIYPAAFIIQPLPALTRSDLDVVITADPIGERGLGYPPLFRYEAQLALSKRHRQA